MKKIIEKLKSWPYREKFIFCAAVIIFACVAIGITQVIVHKINNPVKHKRFRIR